MSVCIFKHCLEGLHVSCIQFGPLPTTVGGRRVVCACLCHTNGGDTSDLWTARDADRMATAFALNYGVDPRVEQIVEGSFRAAGEGDT